MTTFYRRLPRFDYISPGTFEEALHLLDQHAQGGALVYAGGTDLLPKLKGRMIRSPELLIDLKAVPNLDFLEWKPDEGLRIGPLTTITSVAETPLVREKFPILSQAANSIAARQIRNRGTLAGNICSAVPSADSAPALLALGAKLHCENLEGERWIDMADFFQGPHKSALGPGELLREIQIPDPPPNSRGIYIKLSPRRSMDLAIVGVAALVTMNDNVCKDIRIALGAVAPTPIRALKAENILRGNKVNEERIDEAARTAVTEASPIDDHRASAEYRSWMIEVLVRRAVHMAINRH